jgi:hypothetical protein
VIGHAWERVRKGGEEYSVDVGSDGVVVWTVLVVNGPLMRSLAVERFRPTPVALVGPAELAPPAVALARTPPRRAGPGHPAIWRIRGANFGAQASLWVEGHDFAHEHVCRSDRPVPDPR